MLIELLRPAGPELARRWLAVLTLVRPEDREALVAELERRAAALYAPTPTTPPAAPRRPKAAPLHPRPAQDDGEFHVVHPPVARDGYTERLETTYAKAPAAPADAKPARRTRRA